MLFLLIEILVFPQNSTTFIQHSPFCTDIQQSQRQRSITEDTKHISFNCTAASINQKTILMKRILSCAGLNAFTAALLLLDIHTAQYSSQEQADPCFWALLYNAVNVSEHRGIEEDEKGYGLLILTLLSLIRTATRRKRC